MASGPMYKFEEAYLVRMVTGYCGIEEKNLVTQNATFRIGFNVGVFGRQRDPVEPF